MAKPGSSEVSSRQRRPHRRRQIAREPRVGVRVRGPGREAVAKQELGVRLGRHVRRRLDRTGDDEPPEHVAPHVGRAGKPSAISWATVDFPAAIAPVTRITAPPTR